MSAQYFFFAHDHTSEAANHPNFTKILKAVDWRIAPQEGEINFADILHARNKEEGASNYVALKGPHPNTWVVGHYHEERLLEGPFVLPEGWRFKSQGSFQIERDPNVKVDMKTQLEKALGKATKSWADVALAIRHARRVLLWGPPGTGKSYIGAGLRPDNAELFRLYLTMDTPAAEVRGHYLPNEQGGFSWHDGPGVAAWRSGGRLVIDEIDQASGDTLTLLMALLDDPESARLTLPTNELIVPDNNFTVVATTNQKPSVLPEALLDRFDVVMHVPMPSPDAFKAKWYSDKLRDAAIKTIFLKEEAGQNLIKEARANKNRHVGLRAFRAIDRIHGEGKIEIKDAARLVIGDDAGRWLMTALKIAE
jgi:hypothetical protein